MADTYASLSDQRLTAVLSMEWSALLADRGAAIRNHPALAYKNDMSGKPSLSTKVALVGTLGYTRLSSVADGAAIPATALPDSSVTLAAAKYGKRYESTDHALLTDPFGIIANPGHAARDALISADATLLELVAALADGFSNQTTGSAGAAFTVDTWYEAVGILEANNPASSAFLAIMKGDHIREFAEDLRGETGVLQYLDDTQRLQRILPNNIVGNYMGVDIVRSSFLPTNGGDTVNVMFGREAVYWVDADYQPGPAAIGAKIGKTFVEFSRTSANGQDEVTVHAFFGVSEGQDLAGVGMPALT